MKTKSKPKRRTANPSTAAQSGAPARSPAPTPFPIVGIGASAGGLEALEKFLSNVPERSGMAFVIVQHLDPTRKGIMSSLLQRATGMTVAQVRDGTRVQPDCVYVIPPDRDMSILHGVLHLMRPTAPRGLRLPIDFFLRSLAQDRHGGAIVKARRRVFPAGTPSSRRPGTGRRRCSRSTPTCMTSRRSATSPSPPTARYDWST